MNRMIKGSIVGAAGVALLMGGFGTYATWTDDAVLGEEGVTAGTLDIDSIGAASWEDKSSDAFSSDWSADDLMVPGDTVAMTRTVTLDAKGKNLGVQFTVTGVSSAAWSSLDVTMTFDGVSLTEDTTTPGTFSRVYAANGSDLDGENDLVVTFSLPQTSTDADKGAELALGEAMVEVSQVRPTAP